MAVVTGPVKKTGSLLGVPSGFFRRGRICVRMDEKHELNKNCENEQTLEPLHQELTAEVWLPVSVVRVSCSGREIASA